jgi:hypothetical protein
MTTVGPNAQDPIDAPEATQSQKASIRLTETAR